MSLHRPLVAVLVLSFFGCGVGAADVATSEQQTGDESALNIGVPLYFNHTYGILSTATVNALQNDAWLKNEFVDVELRTTVRPDLTYTGTYLNMRETYLEFFPDGTFGYPIGVTGIALGDEVTGGADKVVAAWQKEFGADKASLGLVSREVNGVTTPWFRDGELSWTETSAYTACWLMEYVPNAGSTAPRTRHEERAARYAPGKLAQNVKGAFYGLPLEDRQNLRRTLRSAGLIVIGDDDHFVALTAKDGNGRRFYDVRPDSPGHIGLLGLVLTMNRVVTHSEQLGDGRLDTGIGGLPVAFLWFVPPTSADVARAREIAAE